MSAGCRCSECRSIHAEFISHFGHWPTMTHDEAVALRERRADNEASWRKAIR